MTVFIAHAPADRAAAEALEKVIERRGQFVELDDGQVPLRPVGGADVLVLLVSQALMFATARLRLEQRALDAWADGRLVVVRLDKGLAPVGLRDLPAIDASFEAQREFKWNEAADAVREKLRAAAPEAPAGAPRAAAKTGVGGLLWLLLALAALVLIAVAVFGVVPMSAGADRSPSLLIPALAIVGGLALLIALVVVVVSRLAHRRSRRKEAPGVSPAGSAVFVSYARANEAAVLPVIEAAKRAGRKFWLDQQGVNAGDGWAGEIVRAIRGSAGVVVMCSKAAFESDHVKREVYLADRYRKKLAPVFIEAAEPPEDFEYFFAGVQPLRLFETPEADRPAALIRVLGAAS